MNNKLIIALLVAAGLGWWLSTPQNPPTDPPTHTEKPVQTHLPASLNTSLILVSPESAPNTNESSSDILQHIHQLEQCYQEDTCRFADSDPKASYFAVGSTLADDLDLLIQQQQRSEQIMTEVTATAQRLMAFENDHVRAKALSLLALQPPSTNTLSAILRGIKDSHDRGIYQQAMMEFSKYPKPADRDQVTRFLMAQLQHGGQFVGQIISQKVLPLMDEDNNAQWEALLQHLPPTSLRYQYLQANLEEYRLLQGGG